jgi:hypothetical protein
MSTNSQRYAPGLPQSCDRTAEKLGVSIGQQCPPPATPQPPDRLYAVLAWLCRFFLEGFARYAFAIYPGFPGPDDLSPLLVPRRRTPAGQVASPEPLDWQFAALVHQRPPSPGNGEHVAASRRGTPWQSLSPGPQTNRPVTARLAEDRTVADIGRGNSVHSSAKSRKALAVPWE